MSVEKRMSRRHLLRKVAALGAGLALAGPILAACGPTPAPTTPVPKKEVATPKPEVKVVTPPPVATPAMREQITLRVQTNTGVRTNKPREFGKLFMEKNPHITLKYEDVPYDETSMKTEMGFAIGDLPDFLTAFDRWYWMGCYKGWYLPLDDLLKATNAIPDYPGDFYKRSIENSKYEGKTYNVPEALWAGAGTVIYWNRKIIEDAGAKPPTPDMDIYGLQELALKVANKEKGIFGIQADQGSPDRLSNIVRCWGKPSYGVNGDTSTWTASPDGKKFRFYNNLGAEEWYNKWFRPMLDARANPKSADLITGSLFSAGRVAIGHGHQAGPYRAYLEIGGKWDFNTQDAILLPKGPEGRRGTCQETLGKCIYSKSKYPEETLRLIGEVTSYEAGKWDLTSEKGSGYVGRRSVFLNPDILKVHPIHKAISDQLDSGIVEPYSIPWNFRDFEQLDLYRNMMSPLLDGTKTWNEHAPIVQAEFQKLFDQPRP